MSRQVRKREAVRIPVPDMRDERQKKDRTALKRKVKFLAKEMRKNPKDPRRARALESARKRACRKG